MPINPRQRCAKPSSMTSRVAPFRGIGGGVQQQLVRANPDVGGALGLRKVGTPVPARAHLAHDACRVEMRRLCRVNRVLLAAHRRVQVRRRTSAPNIHTSLEPLPHHIGLDALLQLDPELVRRHQVDDAPRYLGLPRIDRVLKWRSPSCQA